MNLQKLVASFYLIIGFLCVFCNSSLSNAQIFYSATSEATGETGRASYDAFGSHFMNPATLVLGSGYNLGGAYQMANPSLETPVSSTALMVDENDPENSVAAGVGYVYKRLSFADHTAVNQDYSLSAAFKVFQNFSVGLIGHQIISNNTANAGYRLFNLTLGALYKPSQYWHFGFVAYDLIDDGTGNLIPVLALAADVNVMDIFKLKTDITRPDKFNPSHNVTLGTGLEFDLGEGFILRTGGFWDTVNAQTYFTAGLGWIGPKLAVAYAFKDNVNVAGGVAHTFETWVNF